MTDFFGANVGLFLFISVLVGLSLFIVFQLQNRVLAELKDVRVTTSKEIEGIRLSTQALQPNLHKQITDSFTRVNDTLNTVHHQIGAFSGVADGIESIRRVMSNVKNRGIWGEAQLGALLENILAQTQYDENVNVKPESRERVEFAVKIPSNSQDALEYVWLPIDAKFPYSNFEGILNAREMNDGVSLEKHSKELATTVRNEAKRIADKYINPPVTTDFAILFLPTESLYAEVLRERGLFESLLNEYKVHVTGPTTLGALLSSLRVGFRTWTWQQKSAQVWTDLHKVYQEAAELGGLLEKAGKQYGIAQKSFDEAVRKSQSLVKGLREIENDSPDQKPTTLSELPNSLAA